MSTPTLTAGPRCQSSPHSPLLGLCIVGKIPTFIYYDAGGTELERVALDDKTPEELAAVHPLPSPPPPPTHRGAPHSRHRARGSLQMLAEKGIHPAEDGGGSSNVDDNSRQL